jgi:hypothetical protein
MNKLPVIFLLFLFSCTQSKLVTAPVLYQVESYSNEVYNEPFFKEEHFGYIRSMQTGDTIKHYYTSETVVKENGKKQFLRNCKVILHKDSLFFQLDDIPFSSNFELRFVKSPTKFDAVYHQMFSIADSSYKPPAFKTISKKISLDKNTYAKGDLLQGKFSMEILASYSWTHKYCDTIFVYGLIKTLVN